MRLLLLTILIAPSLQPAFCQKTASKKTDFYGHKVSAEVCKTLGFKSNDEAQVILNRICEAADVPNNFVMLPCNNTNNCQAIVKDGRPYIIYDNDFLNKIKSAKQFAFKESDLPTGKTNNESNWDEITILAHEISHHLCQHTTNDNLESEKGHAAVESQADEYAGRILYKLGATLEQAQHVMYSDQISENGSANYPSRRERLQSIAKGWNYARDKYSNNIKNNTNQSPNGKQKNYSERANIANRSEWP